MHILLQSTCILLFMSLKYFSLKGTELKLGNNISKKNLLKDMQL